MLAALSSDLVIHSHLSAGTAAIECALEGIPTILIDREKILNSKLRELPKDSIFFDNWDDAINAMNNYFFNLQSYEIGNWSNYLEMFDPFMDNNGSMRIREYIFDILMLLKKGYNKEDIFEVTLDNYSKKWGKDKVIIY